MKQNLKNIGNGPNRLFNQLAAEKKKTILALCLIALMVFMWIKLFAKKAPKAAEAALTAKQQDQKEQENPRIKISFIELPQIQGRNDVITGDFFDPNGWKGFIPEGKNSASKGQANGSVRNSVGLRSRLIRAGLKLEAIEMGRNPHAFINGKLLSMGDKFSLKDEQDSFECEVVRIEKNLVVISCGKVEVEIKLIPVTDGTD
jgi:hypothetical protein